MVIASPEPSAGRVPVLRLEVKMYGEGKVGEEVEGMRISPAAMEAPGGGAGAGAEGTMERFARRGVVLLFGGRGRAWEVRVEESSCRV
jgi:hypothetical protein